MGIVNVVLLIYVQKIPRLTLKWD